MRKLVALLAVLFSCLAAPAGAAAIFNDQTSTETVLRWINGYRTKPDVAHVPEAVRALSRLGALTEPEKSAVYVGFIAGVISANPKQAEELVGKMLPLPAENQWVIVRAVAYSGVPNWQALLRRLSPKLSARNVMIEKYLEGKLPTLRQFALDKDPVWYEKVQDAMHIGPKKTDDVKLANTPELLDTLWGFYFATGTYTPVSHIIALLPWAKDRDSVERLTLGNMAKYTLVNNASRDDRLLAMLKYASLHDAEPARPGIKEVVDAAETVDTARVRKEALASIEDLQRKGPGSRRDMAWWGYLGEGAIAVGCVAAAVVGQVALGLPCVIGGATTSYALKMFSGTP